MWFTTSIAMDEGLLAVLGIRKCEQFETDMGPGIDAIYLSRAHEMLKSDKELKEKAR
jgi:hypothetical protein